MGVNGVEAPRLRNKAQTFLDFQEDDLSGLLEAEDGIGDAVSDKAGAMVKAGSSRTTRGNRLAREASREVNDCFRGDWARKVGVGKGDGSRVVCGVHPLLHVGLFTQDSHTRPAVSECRGERADAGKVLNRGRVIALKAPG